MARPKKKESLKHGNCIMLRLTDIEYERICGEAEATGYPVAVYARKKLIDEQTTIKYEIVADLPELQKLTSEYGKIGNNLNQIARFFHTGGTRSKAMQDEIHECIEKLFELRTEVLKMAGDYNSGIDTYSE